MQARSILLWAGDAIRSLFIHFINVEWIKIPVWQYIHMSNTYIVYIHALNGIIPSGIAYYYCASYEIIVLICNLWSLCIKFVCTEKGKLVYILAFTLSVFFPLILAIFPSFLRNFVLHPCLRHQPEMLSSYLKRTHASNIQVRVIVFKSNMVVA